MKVALALLLIVPCCFAKNFGGINVEGFGQVYVVGSDWNSDFVQVSSNELRLNGGGRIYFAKDSTDGVYPDMYWQTPLNDKHFSYTIDVSNVGCHCNSAGYFIKMGGSQTNGGSNQDELINS